MSRIELYDCSNDEMREATQEDFDRASFLAESYAICGMIMKFAFQPHNKLPEVLAGLRKLLRELERGKPAVMSHEGAVLHKAVFDLTHEGMTLS